jgi:hypothetical protein
MKASNRLQNESSPYLLQHAHNPVNWYPWGPEALEKAQSENKPILVSIGYSACHWCHVMEKESFENEATAAIMNQHFINIKIDREERPDLDHIYMDAVQTMTGSGGWPLNVFLTPEAKPFYGGTYFPPQRAHNRPSWTEVLLSINQAFSERQHEIISQAENLTAHLLKANQFGQNPADSTEDPFHQQNTKAIFQQLMGLADRTEGGFGRPPKFPQTLSIQYLLAYYHFYKDKTALDHACLCLDKMIAGGIYDQIGGGFSRYATDTEWLVPHFEKMLYDNALLITVLSEAYQITQNDSYKRVIHQTMDFISRELQSAEHGFFAALDADSEGEEGRYYVWTKKEIEKLLGNKAAMFCAYYDVSEAGNWEGKNILNTPAAASVFTAKFGLNPIEFDKEMAAACQQLLQQRNQRIRPQLDDKILLGWNALMNTACSKAFTATGEPRYRQQAIDNMEFLLTRFSGQELLMHTYKNGKASYQAFLDDYAFLIQALIQLQEITADSAYLLRAKKLTAAVLEGYAEEESGFFYFTHSAQKDVIIRKREVYDSATPSGNAVMAGNLAYLSVVFDKKDWMNNARKTISTLSNVITRHPVSFGAWACQLLFLTQGIKEIVMTGANFNNLHLAFLLKFMPATVFQASATQHKDFPLLMNKQFPNHPLIYLCQNYACKAPVKTLDELEQLTEN